MTNAQYIRNTTQSTPARKGGMDARPMITGTAHLSQSDAYKAAIAKTYSNVKGKTFGVGWGN